MFPKFIVARVAQSLGLGAVLAMSATATPAAAAQATFVPCDPGQLSAAIATANQQGSGVLSLAPNCVYTLSSPLPAITGNITIDANGDTITRSSSAQNFRIFTVAANGHLTLQQATVSNGVATGSFPDNFGGGIANFGFLDVVDSRIRNNTADFSGGIGNVATAMIVRTTVSGNTTTHNGGGAANDGSMTIVRSRFNNNSATGFGGGIANDGSLTVRDSNVNGNVASDGGGIANLTIGSNAGTAIVQSSNVNDNTATDGIGAGGILNQPPASVTLTDSRVRGNTPTNCAGTVPDCTN